MPQGEISIRENLPVEVKSPPPKNNDSPTNHFATWISFLIALACVIVAIYVKLEHQNYLISSMSSSNGELIVTVDSMKNLLTDHGNLLDEQGRATGGHRDALKNHAKELESLERQLKALTSKMKGYEETLAQASSVQAGDLKFGKVAEYNGKGGLRTLEQTVRFPQPFKCPPKVVVAIKNQDTNNDNTRIDLKVLEVSVDSARIRIGTWDSSFIFQMTVTWVAYASALC